MLRNSSFKKYLLVSIVVIFGIFVFIYLTRDTPIKTSTDTPPISTKEYDNEQQTLVLDTRIYAKLGNQSDTNEYISLTPNTYGAEESITSGGESLSDFLESLEQKKSKAEDLNITTSNVYIISTTTEEIRLYGNTIGKIIQDNTSISVESVKVFELFINDPENTVAKNTITNIANGYLYISEALTVADSPSSVEYLHSNLIQGYKGIGESLLHFTNSGGTIDYVILYNASADVFATAYIETARYFQSNGVIFNEAEPGYIFTLSF